MSTFQINICWTTADCIDDLHLIEKNVHFKWRTAKNLIDNSEFPTRICDMLPVFIYSLVLTFGSESPSASSGACWLQVHPTRCGRG